MRSQTVMLSILFFLMLASVPTPSSGLTVTITATPGMSPALTLTSFTTTLVNGKFTTIVDLSNIVLNGFTITCSLCVDPITMAPLTPQVIAEQSSSVERIIIANALITAPTPVGACSSANPCVMTITASSDCNPPTSCDFPTKKDNKDAQGNPLSYPSGAFMSGAFSGTITNDTISAVGVANSDFINPTPPGPADTPASLPKFCSGDPACAFSPSPNNPSVAIMDNYIAETIPLNCGAATSCNPSVGHKLTVSFANPSDSVDLPSGTIQSGTHSAAPLIGTLVTPLAGFSSTQLDIIALSSFTWRASFTLPSGTSIDPVGQLVSFDIGPFGTTIPAGSFSIAQGNFVFDGPINGVTLSAKIIPLGGNTFEFRVDGQGANLTGAVNPVPVDLSIQNAIGSASVIANFM